MAKIAFLGLGKMGSGMAGCLLAAGNEVNVWNRSADKAEPLAAMGCTISATPAEAARNADVILSMVADDDASERVWLADDGALSTASPGTLAIECSTISHLITQPSPPFCRNVLILDLKYLTAGGPYGTQSGAIPERTELR